MCIEIFSMLNPLFAFMFNVAIQISEIRIFRLSLLKSIYVGFLAGAIFVFMAEYRFYSLIEDYDIWYLAANSLIYTMLSYCYFHFINLGQTARRIRILREIYETPEGLGLEEILLRYNAQMIISVRLNRLLENGQIIKRGGKYFISRKTVFYMSKMVFLAKKFILNEEIKF